jgi:hypothetical protein
MATQQDAAQVREVTIGTDGKADLESARVNKQRGDIVMWRAAPGGGPWRITFDKGDCTPFREAVFDVPANGVVISNRVHETAVAPKKYKYRIRSGASPFTETQDPDVDVE